ncbi:hypothetical protein [Sphingopyxis sp. MG]|jgi:hypothetical protein|nr:hypothetical protein [Sphingopyxis sp. MG]
MESVMSRKGGFTPASIDVLKTGSLGDPLMPGLRIAPDLTRQKLARPFDRARPLGMDVDGFEQKMHKIYGNSSVVHRWDERERKRRMT